MYQIYYLLSIHSLLTLRNTNRSGNLLELSSAVLFLQVLQATYLRVVAGGDRCQASNPVSPGG